jgi:hypothetical protein
MIGLRIALEFSAFSVYCRKTSIVGILMMKRAKVAAWSLALAASASPILILLFGLSGVHGNSFVTAFYLFLTIGSVAFFGSARNFCFGTLDILLIVFVITMGISFLINPLSSNLKEIVLLGMTLAGYPAARCLESLHVALLKQALFWVSGIIVGLGVLVTVPVLFSAWFAGDIGRPFVFGFDNAATAFSLSLGFFVIAFLTSEPDLRSSKGVLATALISISTAVAAASMVRFTLLAVLGILALSFVLSVRERRLSLTLGIVVVLSIGAGLLARPSSTAVFMSYAIEGLGAGEVYPSERQSPAEPPASLEAYIVPPYDYCTSANTRNSLAIRKVLLFDSIYLAPRAGLTGLGLDSFGVLGCFRGYSPHNDVLQATVEFGWLGGTTFFAMIGLPLILLFGPARSDSNIRFLFLFCAFTIMLSMIYGRISRDVSMFFALGLLGSVVGLSGSVVSAAVERVSTALAEIQK